MSDVPGRTLDAVVFDLDGVLTDTAEVHLRAWSEVFNAFLEERAVQESGHSGTFREFARADYLEFVDGKPRYEGVASFLASREIALPRGEPTDAPGSDTICALGNRKNARFNELLQRDGVKVLPGVVRLLRELREHGDLGVAVGVATASRNARGVLEAAGIRGSLAALVDGEAAASLGLPGKPAPDTLLAAASAMGACPDRSVLVEDAVAGIKAAAAGGFGMVVGVARHGEGDRLLAAGADVVVTDLSELDVERMERWFADGLELAQWSVEQHGFDPEIERRWETLCTVGNGCFATRGAAEEGRAGRLHYPGTYRAGLFNRLESRLAGRVLIHEDMVNLPNWLPVQFRIEEDDWQDLETSEVAAFHRRLDLRKGELRRTVILRDAGGRETRVESWRFVSMESPRIAGLGYRVEPLNYEGTVTVRSGLDAGVVNGGVERYASLNRQHLEVMEMGGSGAEVWLAAHTKSSGIEIAQAARSRFLRSGKALAPEHQALIEGSAIFSRASARLGRGESLSVEKVVAVHTSLDSTPEGPLTAARRSLAGAAELAALGAANHRAWAALWDECDIEIRGDRKAQKLLRFNAYHLLVTAGPHHEALDAGIPARGLHGEGYRGHIFWDEMFVLPYYLLHLPETARAALLYRCRRLGRARAAAAAEGRPGALFPWQSGSDGREETPLVHLNPATGIWGPDHSRLQRHVSLAIGYNVWLYVRATGDLAFLVDRGAEVLVEIARYWVDLCDFDPDQSRYSISGVMGPDEFHEGYPGTEGAGIRDNAYTSLMVSWLLTTIPALLGELTSELLSALRATLNLGEAELEHWAEIGRRLHVPVSEEGVLEQFAGFFELEELDWEEYCSRYGSRYGDVARLDRILKAEGDSPDRYQAIKQADALMPFYLLPAAALDEVLERLELPTGAELLEKSFAYYFPRTTHGSTLSAVVHGRLAHRLGRRELASRLFQNSLRADYDDIQGGTAGEGIHAGTLAGALLWVLEDFLGIELHGDRLALDPRLPGHWRYLACRVRHRGARFGIEVTGETLRIELLEAPSRREVEVRGSPVPLRPGEQLDIALSDKN